jgi:hypothetical protein
LHDRVWRLGTRRGEEPSVNAGGVIRTAVWRGEPRRSSPYPRRGSARAYDVLTSFMDTVRDWNTLRNGVAEADRGSTGGLVVGRREGERGRSGAAGTTTTHRRCRSEVRSYRGWAATHALAAAGRLAYSWTGRRGWPLRQARTRRRSAFCYARFGAAERFLRLRRRRIT